MQLGLFEGNNKSSALTWQPSVVLVAQEDELVGGKPQSAFEASDYSDISRILIDP